jgi:hypothetical protein
MPAMLNRRLLAADNNVLRGTVLEPRSDFIRFSSTVLVASRPENLTSEILRQT